LKDTNSVVSSFRWVAVAGVGLLAILGGSGCNSKRSNGGTSSTASTTGKLSVRLGFGAVTSTPYKCTGEGTMTMKSSSGETKSKKYAYSGFSSTTPNSPACSTTVMFDDLQPGKWNIEVGAIKCPGQVEVKAGKLATATFQNEGGGCQ
jgi:hypothetical protein